jgi:hypothetical protein
MDRDSDYAERLKRRSDEELITDFNREVGNQGWTSSRASYLAALHREFIVREFDYSAVGDEVSLSLKSRVRLNAKTLERI